MGDAAGLGSADLSKIDVRGVAIKGPGTGVRNCEQDPLTV